MFHSLSSRIVALGTLVVVSLLTVTALLIAGSYQARESFRWATHSATVIETIGDGLAELRAAASGLRAYALTGDPAFVVPLADSLTQARRDMAQVITLTEDNPLQNRRARSLATLMDLRAGNLRNSLNLARASSVRADGAVASTQDRAASPVRVPTLLVASWRGQAERIKAADQRISAEAGVFLVEEHALQAARGAAADQRLAWLRHVALSGVPVIALLVALLSIFIVRGIRRPVRLMQQAMSALGHGDHDARIMVAMGSSEFGQLALGYNAMADRLDAAVAEQRECEHQLQILNDELRDNSAALRDRSAVIELLGGMAHRMQAARTDQELEQVISIFAPRIMPGLAGAVYAHNNSRNVLIPVAAFGGFAPSKDGFAPDECWALRRGQSHSVTAPGSDILCQHVGDSDTKYHCEPLLAGGEVMGSIVIFGGVDSEIEFRLKLMAENVASALVNHSLQRDLREQTIRDPLTGLFNRRYMVEALTLEVARSARSGAPLCLVMCDIDHFKRFNDEYGHEAGDAVLHAIATEMRVRFRDGDVVCRYGGEEFTIIAPGTSAEALQNRVEVIRQAISEISLVHAGRLLGKTTMSFGIANWVAGLDRDGSALVRSADAALYRAKRDGRNRTIVELREEPDNESPANHQTGTPPKLVLAAH